jgi:hypothetical protein
VLTKFTKLGDDTKFSRLGVDTRFRRFSVETIPIREAEDKYPAEPRPIVVEAKRVSKKLVLTNPRRFGVDTRLRRFAVET